MKKRKKKALEAFLILVREGEKERTD